MAESQRFNWRCALGLHSWRYWSEAKLCTTLVYGHYLAGVFVSLDAPIEITNWRQERACAGCGRRQMREVGP